jgi:MerR family transcriptional regulator/heat shock protein HspR
MQADGDAGVYVISVAADLAGLHPQTLRLYERKGLVEPARSEGGNRRYSEQDLARLGRIGELTAAGVNLEGVRRILELQDQVKKLRTELERSRASGTGTTAEQLSARSATPPPPNLYGTAVSPWPPGVLPENRSAVPRGFSYEED